MNFINKILDNVIQTHNTLSSCGSKAWFITELSSSSTRAHNPDQFYICSRCDKLDCHQRGTCTCG